MRWIDIILPQPETNQEFDTLMAEAIYLTSDLPDLQNRHGLDSPLVIEQMAKVGQRLFLAITGYDSQAFIPGKSPQVAPTPQIGDQKHDQLVGYHIVTDLEWASLPWTWLHNSLEFVLEKHPICTATTNSQLPDSVAQRPWMSRLIRAGFLVGDGGDSDLYNTLEQLRPDQLSQPEVLFVPGHTDEPIRRLIRREAEAIESALASNRLGQNLANLDLPEESITPAQLKTQGINYQAIHFAGPTSKPAVASDTEGQFWMNRLIDDVNAPADRELENAMGVEAEVLGVDPITSLLDSVSEKYDREGLSENRVGAGGIAKAGGESISSSRPPQSDSPSPWLLDDGPVEPESLGASGGMPPLVFSNSYRSLTELGLRFTGAGASTFIGPMVPLYSRPARLFAGYFYSNLAEGWCSGAALWNAAKLIRKELGPNHPAWLSYGIRGYGSLSLQYL
jgi:hypothetical protein